MNKNGKARLGAMVEEAIVDANGESEQVIGLFTMIENNLKFPFETVMLGLVVVVEKIDVTRRDEIVAICRRGKHRQAVPILDLPIPKPRRRVRNGSRRTGAICDSRIGVRRRASRIAAELDGIKPSRAVTEIPCQRQS